MRWLAAASLGLVLGLGRTAIAQPREPRSVDFQGGFNLAQTGEADVHGLPGLLLEVRGYRPPHLWLSGEVAVEPAVDLRNPESGKLALLFGGGLRAGAFADAGGRFTFLAGGRIDVLTADHWPGSSKRVHGVRFGPTASAVFLVGHVFGHAMGVEGRVEWLQHAMHEARSQGRWQVGLLISGVLFPEPT